MANEEHSAILQQGVEVWNQWRKDNPDIVPQLSNDNLSQLNLSSINLSKCNLTNFYFKDTNLSGANFSQACLVKADFAFSNLTSTNFTNAYLGHSDFTQAELNGTIFDNADLSHVNLCFAKLNAVRFRGANFRQTELRSLDLSSLDFSNAILSNLNLSWAKFIRANLSGANLSRSQVLWTDFTAANLTGACIEDWHTNSATNLTDVICDYIYLRDGEQERRPSSGNFAPGEFTKLYQKSLETVDLIFRNGIDWDAFAYSFKKIEVENQGSQLDVQSIEKKGDGVLLVRVAVSPDANKINIHYGIMQTYELANKALQEERKAKDVLIANQEVQIVRYEKHINRLMDIVEQQESVQKALAENSRKVFNYDLRYSQLAGGIVDAETVNAEQIGGNIQNTDNQKSPD
jgi:uncharacterized protein YjbI with pentapeptide repeats